MSFGLDPTNVQAWASVVSAIGSVAALIYLAIQIRQLRQATRGTANDQLNQRCFDILKFLSTEPKSYAYFYLNVDMRAEKDSQEYVFMQYAAEALCNLMEDVVLQRDNLSPMERQSWNKFVKDSYARSPVLRRHLTKYRTWYAAKLYEMVEDVRPFAADQL
jgi:hypothetical protein